MLSTEDYTRYLDIDTVVGGEESTIGVRNFSLQKNQDRKMWKIRLNQPVV